jgi:hypothetical protein
MKAYNQMMLLEYQVKYKASVTIGKALQLLQRANYKHGNLFDVEA